VTERSADGPGDMVIVRFAPMKHDETRQFILSFVMKDHGGAAKPLLSKLVDNHYTNGVVLRITWAHPPREAKREIFLSARSGVHTWHDDHPIAEGSRELEWLIKPALVGRRYKISWTQ
jgi:hypothetical protein